MVFSVYSSRSCYALAYHLKAEFQSTCEFIKFELYTAYFFPLRKT